MFAPPEITDGDELAAIDGYSAPFADYQNHQGGRMLYRKLMENPQLLGLHTTVDAFYSAASSGILGQLYDVEEQINALYNVDPTLQTQIDNYSNDIDQLNADIEAVVVQYYATTDPIVQQSLAQQRDSLQQLLDAALTGLINALAQADTARYTKADIAIADNTAINAVSVLEVNEKQVNDVYLNTIAKDIFEFTSAQESTIAAIAGQCPLEGGHTVYLARTLYDYIKGEHIVYDDEVLCAPGVQGNQGKAVTTFTGEGITSIYPNPTDGVLYVVLNSEGRADTYLRIVDIYGRIVMEQKVASNGKQVKLEVHTMPAGMYSVQLMQGQYILDSRKFQIATR